MKRRGRTAPSHVFTTGPWRSEDGDPSCPNTVLGVPVIRRLSSSPDGRALVGLADRRYALTGQTLTVGLPRQLGRYLRTQRRQETKDPWLKEIRPLLRRRPGAGRVDREPRA